VADLRKRIDYVEPDLERLLKNLAWENVERTVRLEVHFRQSVASRLWWKLEWTSEDDVNHSVSSQELDLCLWRAISTGQRRVREQRWKERKAELEANGAGFDDYSI
jgi:hypothetical protein